MGASFKQGECAYCGVVAYVTDDHVPPKCLFGKPRPKLITVPACENCNGGFSMDDEYFRDFFAMDEQGRGNPDREAVIGAVRRSFQRSQARGKRARFTKEARALFRRRTGSDLIQPAVLKVGDGGRLGATVERIATGLFHHHKGYRLPSSYRAYALALHSIPKMDVNVPGSGAAALGFLAMLSATEPYRLGTAFEYRRLQSSNGIHITFWLFTVYGVDRYMAHTFERDTRPFDLPPNERLRFDLLKSSVPGDM